jgi:membrane protein YdbS with pleckstrin-like domain
MRFSVKPVFVGWTVLLAQAPLQLFLTVWSALFFGGIASVIISLITDGMEDGPTFQISTFAIIGLIAFVTVPALYYFGRKLSYARTEYRFFDDRLEFDEGFFTINRKVIRYSDVKEIVLRMGVLQRMCGLGSIYLATIATGGPATSNPFSALNFSDVSASGVVLRDIGDPERQYERIQAQVSLNRTGPSQK